MQGEDWTSFKRFTDKGSAEAVSIVLEAEGVPCRIDTPESVTGIEGIFHLMVPQSLEHRARWILAQSNYTDSELNYLATGKLLGDEEE